MSKRGQAAMEFLMTYGWAILAVLITIAALAYFGVLNPSRFLPQSCTLFPGVACTDVTVNNAGVSLVVQNGLGQNLNPFTVSISGCTPASANNGLADGEKETIALLCNPGLTTNSRFKNDIGITYLPSPPGISHTRKGSIVTQVENGYVLNGGFEYGTNYWGLDGTSSGASATGSADSTTFTSGSNSYRLVVTTAGADPHYPLVYQYVNLPINPETYAISFSAKATASSSLLGVTFSTSIAIIPGCDFVASIPVTTTWTRITRQCTITSTINPLLFYINYPSSGNTLWIDDIEIKKA